MLVLSRKQGQRIHIGDSIELAVIEVRGDKIRLGFTAPPEVAIHREEVYERIKGQPTTEYAQQPSQEKLCGEDDHIRMANPATFVSPLLHSTVSTLRE